MLLSPIITCFHYCSVLQNHQYHPHYFPSGSLAYSARSSFDFELLTYLLTVHGVPARTNSPTCVEFRQSFHFRYHYFRSFTAIMLAYSFAIKWYPPLSDPSTPNRYCHSYFYRWHFDYPTGAMFIWNYGCSSNKYGGGDGANLWLSYLDRLKE